jgi:quercetin dioxygenase-like cupin family protein
MKIITLSVVVDRRSEMSSYDAPVVEVPWKDRSWQPTETPGLTFSVLRQQDGGASIFLKFEKGVVGANHVHPEGEELLVVSGDITVGGRRLGAGDYLYTPPGAAHEAEAHEETVLFLNLPKLPVFI